MLSTRRSRDFAAVLGRALSARSDPAVIRAREFVLRVDEDIDSGDLPRDASCKEFCFESGVLSWITQGPFDSDTLASFLRKKAIAYRFHDARKIRISPCSAGLDAQDPDDVGWDVF